MRIGDHPGPALAPKLAALVAVLGLAVVLPALAASPVAAQTPTTIPASVRCARTKPTVVFVGRVTRIRDDTVTFQVDRVTQGDGAAGTVVDVMYPTEFNARKLELQGSYRVAAGKVRDTLRSVVPTAQLKVCGQSTRNADGTVIDTSTLTGAREQLPKLAVKIGIGLLIALVVLVALGRFLDRKSRYRPWTRRTWRRS